MRAVILMMGLCFACHSNAQGFKFPDENAPDADEAARKDKVAALLSTPCRNSIKQQKIMVVLAESKNGMVSAKQSQYSQHINLINRNLQALGLKTYTQEQIRQQVAQAEIDAYFKNDPDAALAASKRLAANYVLRGLIHTNASRNAMMNVNQVNVSMSFTLTGSNGRLISQSEVENASYAGSDVSGMALTLVKESGEEAVAQLYADYCRQAGKR